MDTVSNYARAYVVSTNAGRDSGNDISLGSGTWVGGVSDGTTVRFINNSSDRALAWNAGTGVRDEDNDIDLGIANWTGGASDFGTTLWFVNDTSNYARAYSRTTTPPPSGNRLFVGSNQIGKVFIGGTEYNKIYRGNTLIWQK